MKFNFGVASTLIGAFIVLFTAPIAWSQAESNRFAQLESLLTAKNWVEADRETIALIRNSSDNLSCRNLRSIDQMWIQYSNGKYGFTPQVQIWNNLGGLTCKTCEGEIKKFSEQVGWILGSQVNTLPGDFAGQYPTVVALGWERYVDNAYGNVSERRRISRFNLFSTLNSCQGQPAAMPIQK